MFVVDVTMRSINDQSAIRSLLRTIATSLSFDIKKVPQTFDVLCNMH